MTPQYSTIRKFDLLCVLKDFVEEYSGDIDTGGVDLNVTFSIVGENPDEVSNNSTIKQKYINELKDYFWTESMLSILPEENIEEDEWYLRKKGPMGIISNSQII